MRLQTRLPRNPVTLPKLAALACTAVGTAMVGCSGGAGTQLDSIGEPADTAESRTSIGGGSPIAAIEGGRVRGVAVTGGYAFLGLPYAAPPTEHLRWRAPQHVAAWWGVRDATAFAPSCPQPPPPATFTAGPTDEDCLYLNVYTPRLGRGGGKALPVLVWIHGGGFTTGAGRDYDASKLAADGVVVVAINYRLGALGFLSHPALASGRGEASGNYGLMDQQASLRWVRDNIDQFGGDPHNVTIAGESAGGLAVLAHLVSRSSRNLFQRAIVESGSFALTQRTLAAAEAEGEAFASLAGCADQSATCLRKLPVADLVGKFLNPVIPGTVDGKVLTESIGTALAGGRFARVPILNGTNHDEELLFVAGLGVAVSGGTFVSVPQPLTPDSYQQAIASVLGVTGAQAAAIAAEYPVDAYPLAVLALSALVGDANFACPALQIDRYTSRATATFAYEFNDDAAPPRFARIPAATHLSELAYLFDLHDAPIQTPFMPDQAQLAATMRAAWASFADGGSPSSAALSWPSFDQAHVMSLVPPQPQIEANFASRHHCSFWAAR